MGQPKHVKQSSIHGQVMAPGAVPQSHSQQMHHEPPPGHKRTSTHVGLSMSSHGMRSSKSGHPGHSKQMSFHAQTSKYPYVNEVLEPLMDHSPINNQRQQQQQQTQMRMSGANGLSYAGHQPHGGDRQAYYQ